MGFWLIAAGGFIFWIIRSARRHSRRVTDAWRQAAAQLGLDFDPGSLTRRKSMRGTIDGNRVEVETFTRNSGSKSSHAVTRYRVHYPEQLASGLQIKPRGLLSNAAAFFGVQNIATGDSDFDSRVVVKGDFPNRVAGFLTPDRRRQVLRLLNDFKGVKIDHQNLEWAKSGVAKNPAEIVEILRELSSAATSLSGSAENAGGAENVAVPLTAAAAAAAVLGGLRADPISVEAPPGLRPREAIAEPVAARDAAAALRDAARAGREPVAAPATAPGPTSLAEAAASATPGPTAVAAAAAGAVPAAAAVANPASPAAPPADAELAVAEVCAQLFTRSVTSTEAKKRFEERYKGKRVRWSGHLRRAATYSIDLVFKGGPGTKATFALPVSSEGSLGGTVQAVVQLSPAAADQLKRRIGEQIAFEGRLLSCDTMVRNFNIADATLT